MNIYVTGLSLTEIQMSLVIDNTETLFHAALLRMLALELDFDSSIPDASMFV